MQENTRLKSAILATSLIISIGYFIYSRRTRKRLPSPEALEDSEISNAYNRIAHMPQMRLLRWYTIQRALKLVDSGEAIDLGCGPGLLAVEMAKCAPELHITGIDLSEEMIAQAEQSARESGVIDRVSFKIGDADQIPFPDNSLDLVISTLSLHHWNDPVGVLNEIERVLRPDGAFMIFDLRRDMTPPAYLLLWFVTNFVVPKALYHINEPLSSRNASYTPEEAAKLVEQSHLDHWCIIKGPLWLTIEGVKRGNQPK